MITTLIYICIIYNIIIVYLIKNIFKSQFKAHTFHIGQCYSMFYTSFCKNKTFIFLNSSRQKGEIVKTGEKKVISDITHIDYHNIKF